jgi:hypothetical protein
MLTFDLSRGNSCLATQRDRSRRSGKVSENASVGYREIASSSASCFSSAVKSTGLIMC